MSDVVSLLHVQEEVSGSQYLIAPARRAKPVKNGIIRWVSSCIIVRILQGIGWAEDGGQIILIGIGICKVRNWSFRRCTEGRLYVVEPRYSHRYIVDLYVIEMDCGYSETEI